MRRVVITGAGTVNPLAQDLAGTLAAMRAGACGIGPLDIPDVERLSVRIGGQVRGWQAADHLGRAVIATADRFAQFALVAAAQAMAQSGLEVGEGADCGVILGTAGAGCKPRMTAIARSMPKGKPACIR